MESQKNKINEMQNKVVNESIDDQESESNAEEIDESIKCEK